MLILKSAPHGAPMYVRRGVVIALSQVYTYTSSYFGAKTDPDTETRAREVYYAGGKQDLILDDAESVSQVLDDLQASQSIIGVELSQEGLKQVEEYMRRLLMEIAGIKA